MDECEEIPAIIRPLPDLDSPTANLTQPLHSLIEDMEKEGEITYENFEKKE